jgi:small membrane protein
MVIQFILIAIAVVLFVFFIRSSHSVRTQAFKRIGFIIFLLLSLDAVLRPNDTTWLAHKVGVGRGADLLLYMLVAAFAFYAVNTFLRFRNLERRFTDLARAVALRDAQLPPEVVTAKAPSRLPAQAPVPETAPGPASETDAEEVCEPESTLSGGSAR